MLEEIRLWLVRLINSSYLGFVQVAESLAWLDSPGTYIVWMVIGFIYIPYFANSLYAQYDNPHGYYSMTLTRKALMGICFICAWILFGYANLRRFLR